MLRMAKKDKRTGSRHKPRRTISLPPRVYAQLAEMAKRHERPINWEARLVIQQALEAEGLWPPPDGVGTEAEEDTE